MSKEQLPDYLKQGETARLFPVLSTTSKEGRTTSIVLACLCKIDEFGAQLLASVGQKVGKRASIETFTEVVFQKQTAEIRERPDGLIVLKIGSRQWRALVDVMRRSVDVGMTLRAPDDKKSTKARVNWLLRQIKAPDTEGLFIRLLWPGGSEPTQYPVAELREDPELASEGKEHLASHGFHVFLSERLGGKFTQQTNFITELERIVPRFYGETGANLAAWVRKAPQIKSERSSGDDVSPSGIAEDAEGFEA